MQISDFQTISLLFSEKNQYKIPRYQRRYVWNMINWETLWQDIIQLTRGDTHFAGTIITYVEKGMVPEILDGQQRLTTFQIILCVIRDLWEAEIYTNDVNAEDKAQIEGYLKAFTQMGTLGRSDDSDPYRLILSSLDVDDFNSVVSRTFWDKEIANKGTGNLKEAFDTLIEKGFNEKGKQSDQHLIFAAYGYFGKEIVRYMENKPLSNLVEFFSVFTSRLNVIKVTIESESDDRYDPERIFQTINDTGRMLTDFDYLRNYLFLRTRKQLDAQNSDQLYDKYWDRFEKWDDAKLEQFFQAYLKAKLGPRCFKGENKNIKPFDCYRKHIKTLEGPDDNFFIPLLELSRYANSYEELNNSDETDKNPQILGNRMRFYDYLELPRLDWFLLFMKHVPDLSDSELLIKYTSENGDSEISEILKEYTALREKDSEGLSSENLTNLCNILESYIVRSWLCKGKYESSYEHIMNFCSQEVNCKPNVQTFVDYLSDTWPDPDKVKKVLREEADSVDPNLILYILCRIEFTSPPILSTLLNSGDMGIKKLVDPGDLYAEVLAKVDAGKSTDSSKELTDKVNRMAGSIGNITREATKKGVNWNMDKISERTDTLLERFDEIWKPTAADYGNP